MRQCDHSEAFDAFVGVHPLADEEGGPITRWAADIKIRCKTCGQPFEFIGVPQGLSLSRPMTAAIYADELRTPIKPAAQDCPRWEQPQDVGHA